MPKKWLRRIKERWGGGSRRHLLAGVLLITMASLLLVPAERTEAQAAQSQLRIVQTMPDGPPVDVYIDGKEVVSAASYKSASPYLPLSAGRHEIRVYPAAVDGDGNPLLVNSIEIGEGSRYTAVILGRLARIDLNLREDDSAVTAGRAKLRILPASPDTPAVDVAQTGGSILFPRASFMGVYDYIEMAPGTLNFELRPAGAAGDTVLAVPGLQLKADTVYTLVTLGLNGDLPKLEAWLLADHVPAASMPKTGGGGASMLAPEAAPAAAPVHSSPAAGHGTGAGFPWGLAAAWVAGTTLLRLLLRRRRPSAR